jgi:hypothetical protein
MKKVLVFALVVFVILSGSVVSAQELGNPAKLIEKGKIDAGVEGVLLHQAEFFRLHPGPNLFQRSQRFQPGRGRF